MKALILAAGYATRMASITQEVPKSLLQIGDKRIIDEILQKVLQIPQVDSIFVVTNQRFFGKFTAWKAGISESIQRKIILLNDGSTLPENRLGAVGDVAFALSKAELNDDLLIIAGDNLFSFSLSGFYDFFRKKNAPVVALHDVRDVELIANRLGAAQVDSSKRIVAFEEKPAHPKSTLAATACYLFRKEDLSFFQDYIRTHLKPDNLGDFIHWLLKKTQVYGYEFVEEWHDVGTVEQYTMLTDRAAKSLPKP